MVLPLLFSIVPALIAGLLLRGRLSGIAQLQLKWMWLVLAGLMVQIVAMGYVGRSWSFAADHRPAIIIGTYLAVLAGLIRNFRVPGMAVVALGFALNFAAIVANGGQMPVTRDIIEASGQSWLIDGTQSGEPVWQSKDVLLPKEDTRLWVLTDIFITPPPVRRAAAIGDFVTYAGVGLLIVFAMKRAQADRPSAPVTASVTA